MLQLMAATGTINLTSTDNRIRSSYAGTGALPSNTTYEGMFAWTQLVIKHM